MAIISGRARKTIENIKILLMTTGKSKASENQPAKEVKSANCEKKKKKKKKKKRKIMSAGELKYGDESDDEKMASKQARIGRHQRRK